MITSTIIRNPKPDRARSSLALPRHHRRTVAT
jgi:hypothetical protein